MHRLAGARAASRRGRTLRGAGRSTSTASATWSTNIDGRSLLGELPSRPSSVSIGGGARRAASSPSYAAVAGRASRSRVVNSWGLLEIAVRDGSARDARRARRRSGVVESA